MSLAQRLPARASCGADRLAADQFAAAAHFFKGRVALFAILKTLGIGPGDRVVLPGYTCVVVPSAVHFAGATPVYADIDPATFNASLEHFQAAAGERPVRAVIVQHTYGMPADAGPIVDWARRQGAHVIEDCCHALGGRYYGSLSGGEPSPAVPGRRQSEDSGASLGTLGDAAFYSSQWSKPITTGLGGWAVASDPDRQCRLHDFAAQCRPATWRETSLLAAQYTAYRLLFRSSLYWLAQGALRRLSRAGVLVGSSTRGELEARLPDGYAKKMWPLGPRLARRELARAAPLIAQRRRLKDLYDEALAAAGLPVYQVPPFADPVLLRYPVRVPDKPRALAEARRRHIELGDWFNHPLHPAGSNVAALGWRPGLCPVAEHAAAEVVNLPMHLGIGPREVDRAVALLANLAR